MPDSTNRIVALYTYGEQRVLNLSKQPVRAIKCAGIIPAIILALFPGTNVIPRKGGTNYTYLELPHPINLLRGFLLVYLTPEEVNAIESTTRRARALGSPAFIWDNEWLRFPTGPNEPYENATRQTSSTIPSFSGKDITPGGRYCSIPSQPLDDLAASDQINDKSAQLPTLYQRLTDAGIVSKLSFSPPHDAVSSPVYYLTLATDLDINPILEELHPKQDDELWYVDDPNTVNTLMGSHPDGQTDHLEIVEELATAVELRAKHGIRTTPAEIVAFLTWHGYQITFGINSLSAPVYQFVTPPSDAHTAILQLNGAYLDPELEVWCIDDPYTVALLAQADPDGPEMVKQPPNIAWNRDRRNVIAHYNGSNWVITGVPNPAERKVLNALCTYSDAYHGYSYPDQQLPVEIERFAQVQVSELLAAQPSTLAVHKAPVITVEQPDNDDGLDLLPDWLWGESAKETTHTAEDGTPLIFAKLFTPDADWTLFVDKYMPAAGLVHCYAIMNGDLSLAEWGYQELSDLQAVTGSFKLPMERDTSFTAQSFTDAIQEYRVNRGDSSFTAQSLSKTLEDSRATHGREPDASLNDILHISTPTPHATFHGFETVDLINVPTPLSMVDMAELTDALNTPVPKGKLAVPQQYVGTINQVGDCYCFGVAIDRQAPTYANMPIYLSIAGSGSSVDAVWARLVQGKSTRLYREDGSLLTTLEPQVAGAYDRHIKRIEALSIVHLIMTHESLANPSYSDPEDETVPSVYLLAVNNTQRITKFGDHLRKIIKVNIFDEWLDFIIQAGHQHGLVRECTTYGGLQTYAVTADTKRWTEIVTEALVHQKITFPT